MDPNIQTGRYHVEICGDLQRIKFHEKEVCFKSEEFFIEGVSKREPGSREKHEIRFFDRQYALENRLSGENLEKLWPVNGTQCTVHRIHQPTKERFTEECMKPGKIWIFFLTF